MKNQFYRMDESTFKFLRDSFLKSKGTDNIKDELNAKSSKIKKIAQSRISKDSIKSTEDGLEMSVISTTETPAYMFRYDYEKSRFMEYMEVLSCKEEHIRDDYLKNGLSILNGHMHGLSNTIGKSLGWRCEGKKLILDIKVIETESTREIIQKIKAGVLDYLSVGYFTYGYKETNKTVELNGKELPIYKVEDWEPYECSFVSVPADPNAIVMREMQSLIIPKKSIDIKKENPETLNINEKNQKEIEKMPQAINITHKEEPTQSSAPSREAIQKMEAEANARALEFTEQAYALRDKHNIDPEKAKELIAKAKGDMTQLRSLFLEELETGVNEKLKEQDPQAAPFKTISKDANLEIVAHEEDKINEQIQLSMGYKIAQRSRSLTDDQKQLGFKTLAHEFKGMTFPELAMEYLKRTGEKSEVLSRDGAIRKVFEPTSGFPKILEDATYKTLRDNYKDANSMYDKFTFRDNVVDFKDIHSYQYGGIVKLEEVKENEVPPNVKFTEDKTSFSMKTYQACIPITRKALINDDLAAFARIIDGANRSIKDLEKVLVIQELTKASYYSVAAGNQVAGAAPSVDSFQKMNNAFFKQKYGDQDLELAMEFLIIPGELESEVLKMLKELTPNKTSDVNPFSSKIKGYVKSAKLTSTTEWYGFCGKAAGVAPIGIFGLKKTDGTPSLPDYFGPEIDVMYDVKRRGLEVNILNDIACKMLDPKAYMRNPGA